MIVYTATKARFQQGVLSNDIGNIIYSAFKGATGRGTNRAEINDATVIPADAGAPSPLPHRAGKDQAVEEPGRPASQHA